jgi:hypothetical protein
MGQRQITYHLFLLITGITTNMLLIILLDLIAKLASVSSECDIGPLQLKDFDWTKVVLVF